MSHKLITQLRRSDIVKKNRNCRNCNFRNVDDVILINLIFIDDIYFDIIERQCHVLIKLTEIITNMRREYVGVSTKTTCAGIPRPCISHIREQLMFSIEFPCNNYH